MKKISLIMKILLVLCVFCLFLYNFESVYGDNIGRVAIKPTKTVMPQLAFNEKNAKESMITSKRTVISRRMSRRASHYNLEYAMETGDGIWNLNINLKGNVFTIMSDGYQTTVDFKKGLLVNTEPGNGYKEVFNVNNDDSFMNVLNYHTLVQMSIDAIKLQNDHKSKKALKKIDRGFKMLESLARRAAARRGYNLEYAMETSEGIWNLNISLKGSVLTITRESNGLQAVVDFKKGTLTNIGLLTGHKETFSAKNDDAFMNMINNHTFVQMAIDAIGFQNDHKSKKALKKIDRGFKMLEKF